MTGKIFNIQPFSTTDGPGIRTVVFFQGCNLRCFWCHNPESWGNDDQYAFFEEKCISCGSCEGLSFTDAANICYAQAKTNITRTLTPQKLWEIISVELPYMKNSGGGVTFSGGECMLQVDFLQEMVKICRQNGIHTAVDTAGHVPYDWLTRVNPDLFLYDIKAVNTHEALTGVDGKLIWQNLKKLVSDGYTIKVRVPCVPDCNWDDLPDIAKKLKEIGIKDIELLPYHRLGEGKFGWFGETHNSIRTPSDEEMEKMKERFF